MIQLLVHQLQYHNQLHLMCMAVLPISMRYLKGIDTFLLCENKGLDTIYWKLFDRSTKSIFENNIDLLN